MKRRDFVFGNMAAAAGIMMTSGRQSLFADDPSGSRIRQSIMGWCFKPMDMLKLAAECKRIGLEAMEGIDSKLYDQVTAMGLKISLVGSHGFANGPLDPENHAMVEKKLRDGIDLAVKYGAPNVITFTGMSKE